MVQMDRRGLILTNPKNQEVLEEVISYSQAELCAAQSVGLFSSAVLC